ncbi:hypothetical protein E4T43_05324 [Aureobasidium subglaciale]|nr:hypothetical protein E4T43_05324 [Aureobasidium subglaciale]
MSTPRVWDSHIWTEKTFLAHLSSNDQQRVEIRTKERMPQSFHVPRSLFLHYCPKSQPAHTGDPFDFETSNRAVLVQFINWLHTGKIAADADWYMATELYFVAAQVGSIALARSAMTQLQKACKEPNKTDLFHYGHITVVEDMVGTDSALFRYVEDTYFNHWTPDNDANDSASEHEKPGLFFKRLYERSFREQRDIEICSCCHNHCKYHDHESEAERLATCGHLAAHTPIASPSVDASKKKATGPGLSIRPSRKRKAAVRKLMSTYPVSEDEDSLLRETRSTASRAGTPRTEPATGSWLKEKCSAPADFPDDYHGLLTSLPQVKSIKAPDWLLEGLKAAGIEQLPEPDRIIAAALAWDAEGYAQTKCSFFNQYDVTNRDRNHWLNTLKFGGPRPKERADMLLAMWECLGWLKSPETVINKELDRVCDAVTARPLAQTSIGGKTAWSQEEKDAVAKIMGEIETDRTFATDGADQGDHVSQPTLDGPIINDDESQIDLHGKKNSVAWTEHESKAMMDFMRAFDSDPASIHLLAAKRAELCRAHLKAGFDTNRTVNAITIRYYKARREAAAEAQTRAANITNSDYTIRQPDPATVTAGADQREFQTPLAIKKVVESSQGSGAATGSVGAIDTHKDPAHSTMTQAATKQAERWTQEEHGILIKVYEEIEADPALVNLDTREREELCSKRLKVRHGIERSSGSVRGRLSRSNLFNDVSVKRDRGEDDHDDLEPLMTRQKRRQTKSSRQTKSRFVNELFNAGEE